MLIDVAGESETPLLSGDVDWSGRRDSTAVTVVEIGRGEVSAGYGSLPVYRVVDRMAWTGESHVSLHAQLVELARRVWKASIVVVDSTGVGAGLASFLAAQLSRRDGAGGPIPVMPFVFTSQSKSRLGWDFQGLINLGRYREYRDHEGVTTGRAQLTAMFWAQMRSVSYEVMNGPGKQMRWSVPAGRGHDDLVMSAALTAVLDGYELEPRIAKGSRGLW